MQRFQRVLVNLNNDESDQKLITYLKSFVEEANSIYVEFMHVVDGNDQPSLIENKHLRTSKSIDFIYTQLLALIEKNFEGIRSPQYKLTVVTGSPVWEILKASLYGNFDLIVIEKDDHNFLVSEKIARKSPCAVLLMSPTATPQYRKILVPVDFSELSIVCVEIATHLTMQRNINRVFLFHSVEGGVVRSIYSRTEPEIEKEFKKIAHEKMAVLKEDLSSNPVTYESYVDSDFASWKGISRFCDQLDPDLIILGSRGVGSKSHVLLGGTQNSSCGSAITLYFSTNQKGPERHFLNNSYPLKLNFSTLNEFFFIFFFSRIIILL